MNELQSNESLSSINDCNSSFESLRFSGNQPQSLNHQNDLFQSIQEVPQFQLIPEKSLAQSIRDTLKICCSGIRTIKTNFAYNIRHSNFDVFKSRERVTLDQNQPVTLLGKTYQNNSKQKQNFYEHFMNTIWLTYRNGIYGIQSDAGWGCMIRVCQMVLAETFKRVSSSKNLNHIINHFRDTPDAYFSLTRICEKGDINERWTSSIEIFSLFKTILPTFNFVNLQIEMHSSCIQIYSLEELQKMGYPLLIFVSNRLGKNKLEVEFKDHLLQVMKLPQFVGCVGGNRGEALYLIGHYCGKIIFMDPHYVHSYEQEQQDKKTSTYFQSQPYSIDFDSLSPSLAFNFLVKSVYQYKDLLVKLYEIQIRHQPWVCFQVLSQQIKKHSKNQIHKDDDFQILQ